MSGSYTSLPHQAYSGTALITIFLHTHITFKPYYFKTKLHYWVLGIMTHAKFSLLYVGTESCQDTWWIQGGLETIQPRMHFEDNILSAAKLNINDLTKLNTINEIWELICYFLFSSVMHVSSKCILCYSAYLICFDVHLLKIFLVVAKLTKQQIPH